MKRASSAFLCLIVLSAIIHAAPRHEREREPTVAKVVKIVKRALGIGTNGDGLTPPTPPPCTGTCP